MYGLLSSTAFLSGCIPIAFINVLLNYNDMDYVVSWFSYGFILISIICGVFFMCLINRYFRQDNEIAVVEDIKRKDVFTSGAISYYVLPFISFVTGGRGGVYILSLLTLLFLKVFINNRMFLYTPLFDILGYKILECTLTINGSKPIMANIITPDGNDLLFTGENNVRVMKIDQGIYVAKLCKDTED